MQHTMDAESLDRLKQIDALLATGNQSWLFGAGISMQAGIPLMWPLTDRVFAIAGEKGQTDDLAILIEIKSQLEDTCHIEQMLSHLGDYRSMAERAKDKKATIGTFSLDLAAIDAFHVRILAWIADTIRWGYKPAQSNAPESIGNRDHPIVNVNGHVSFMEALFNRAQAGVAERRRAARVFTTNYDTLLEDALALSRVPYWDGFDGGALAYRNHRYGDAEPDQRYRAHLVKLHGSIDWRLSDDDRVWRVRDGDVYPTKAERVLIYPQATKYLATQRDPFAAQFDLFRRALSSSGENVLATCGYSFGDEHINQEIELAMQRPENKTTVIAFAEQLNSTLANWQKLGWANRLYIVTGSGLFVGADGPFAPPPEGEKWDWWTFSGVTQLLSSGAESFLA